MTGLSGERTVVPLDARPTPGGVVALERALVAEVTSSLLCECGERASGQELVEAQDLRIEDPVG